MYNQLAIDVLPMEFNRSEPNFKKLIPGFKQDYPGIKEEMDPGFSSFGPVLQTTILVDTDYAHNQLTHRSLTGMIGYVGSTVVTWGSKRQKSIASSMYATELSALCTSIEEAQNLRYMLRSLRCNLPCDRSAPARVSGDNLSVILNPHNPACGQRGCLYVHGSFWIFRRAKFMLRYT